jgi:O-antigen/teichoic acid export membrane protein
MSIKKNYGFNLLNSLLNIVFPIVTFPYAARILSPEGIGEAQFIFSLAQYFAILAAFGIPIYGVKAIAEVKHNKELLSKVTTELLVILSMLVAVVLGIYSLVVINIPELNANWPAHAIASSIIFLTVFNVDWFFSGTEQFKILALRSALVKGLSLIILFTLVKTQQDTLEYLFFLVFLYIGNYFLNFFLSFQKHQNFIRQN